MHYQLMSLEDIKNMPVADLAEENAHLWLWIPNGLLQEGLDVMKAWGFKYRDPFYWIKPRLGLGNYLRNASESRYAYHHPAAQRDRNPAAAQGGCHQPMDIP